MDSEGVLMPLVHEHLMMPWNDLRKGDCCGLSKAVSVGYYCKSCDFFAHKKCGESSEFIQHPSHPDHTLQLRSSEGCNICNLCGRTISDLFYRCDLCDFDVDLYCAKYPPPEVIDIPETHHHKLNLHKELIEFNCDAKCGKITGAEFPYVCYECQLPFHVDCVWRPSELKHPSEGVLLPWFHNNKHVMMPWNDMRKGDCCGSLESVTDGFYCKSCDFFVHKICAMSSKFIEHPSDPNHPLELHRYGRHACDSCGRSKKADVCYACYDCYIEVDLYCAKYPPPEVIDIVETHHHKLTLLKERIEFDCDAKCGETGDGFPYKCPECDLFFHVDCVWHPPERVPVALHFPNHLEDSWNLR
ncbi:unnamed protein product [Arabidopsis thaliana]|nr:unnamed protein product [Arabidopsis thaliana]